MGNLKQSGGHSLLISGAKTSSIVDILGLFVHVEGGLDISKRVYHPFTLKENS